MEIKNVFVIAALRELLRQLLNLESTKNDDASDNHGKFFSKAYDNLLV